jgi:hypothetical protein
MRKSAAAGLQDVVRNLLRSPCTRWIPTVVMLPLLFSSGCQNPQTATPQPPGVNVTLTHFAGTPLSGPTATKPPSDPSITAADAPSVRVTFKALEHPPDHSFDALASQARLISSTTSNTPLLFSAKLTREAQFIRLHDASELDAKLTAAKAGRITPITALTAALPPGVTADFTMREPKQEQRRLRVEVSRGAVIEDPLRLALVLEQPTTRPAEGPQSERALVDLASKDHDCVALVLPYQFVGNDRDHGLAIVVEATPGTDDDAHQFAFALSNNSVRRSIDAVTARGNAAQSGEDWASIQAAVDSLSQPAARRASLAFLAGRTGADVCEDVAMVADDAMLKRLAESSHTAIAGAASTPPPTDATVGWALDHAAYQLLADLLNTANMTNGTPMPDELAATLASHAGEAGRHPSSMQQILNHVSSRDEFNNRLLAENLIFLEDTSPASRVRAFDWLTACGQAPAGFDPLGTPKERRHALEGGMNAAAATTTAPTTAPTSPTAAAAGLSPSSGTSGEGRGGGSSETTPAAAAAAAGGAP